MKQLIISEWAKPIIYTTREYFLASYTFPNPIYCPTLAAAAIDTPFPIVYTSYMKLLHMIWLDVSSSERNVDMRIMIS